MATFNQDPINQQTITLAGASILLLAGSSDGILEVNYVRFQQDGTGPTYFMNIELGGGGSGTVPTTGQIWPRGLN